MAMVCSTRQLTAGRTPVFALASAHRVLTKCCEEAARFVFQYNKWLLCNHPGGRAQSPGNFAGVWDGRPQHARHININGLIS
jgi:hypothetical protein